MLKSSLLYLAFLSLLLLAVPGGLAAQQKIVQPKDEIWFGYLTSVRLSRNYSIWNDFHYIPEGFAVGRTGLTRHFSNHLDVTAGYAYALLPLAGELKRHEHRPWGQIVLPADLGNGFSLLSRLRWDLRYRQQVAGAEIAEGYAFNHRGRVQAVLRKSFPKLTFNNIIPSVVLADELLMNLGKEVVTNHFDQNRISLMAALRHKGLMLQAGYMNRYIQSATPGSYTSNHGMVFWLFHNIDFSKRAPLPPESP